jgi:hypothetical protein
MAQFSNFADTPDGIIKEGQEITIKFVRNGDGTATVSWNIPPPANGCTSDTQAYNGIVVTIDTKAANYRSTSPTNATMYVGDPTADRDLFAGDTLDTALIEGAFYNDKTTTSLTINNIDPNTFYYVSGYAVDNVGTYHREGVHAYSLPTGEAETPITLYNAFQDISLIPKDSSKITLNTLTGLSATQTYVLHIKIDNIDHYISVPGVDAQSYFDLINTLNEQFKLLTGTSYSSPLPPNANQYYLDIPNNKLYFWDGTHNNQTGVIFFGQDPNTKPQGTYWVNPSIPSSIMMYETGGWSLQPFISLDHDPRTPNCGELWFTGTNAYEFDGDHWCQLCLYIQTRNPSLAPILDCNTFWYDTTNSLLMKWNFDNSMFNEVLAIISVKDPNTLSTGDFWLNETDGKIYRYVSGTWSLLTTVRYDAPDIDGNLPYPAAGTYWLNPLTQIFYKRSSDNTSWIETNYTMYPTDPLERKSCDLWWNQSQSVDTLYVWDIINLAWKPVINFLQQATDPSLPPNLPNCAVWYNPATGILQYILRNSCAPKTFISSMFDPTHPVDGTVWFNNLTGLYYVWDGAEWEEIYPIISITDPFVLFDGYFWFDPITNVLSMWNGTEWAVMPYSTKPLNSPIDTLWFDTASGELYEWSGTAWNISLPIITVSLKYQISKDPNTNGRAYLFFLFNDAGCGHIIDIMPDSGGLFASVIQSVIYHDPMIGGNGPASGPMYKQLDVGTDGTPDERRTLQATLRTLLGSTATTVELSKVNFDIAIDNALLQFRKYSSYSVTRNLFFLDAKPNQQTYQMANKCVGFNKITSIRAIYRMQAGWIRTGLAGNELFGVAALQQLYTVGTFDMLSFGMMSMYMKELEQMFASRIMHQWVESTRELRLFQRIVLPERLLLDANIERTEQDIITNRASALWIQSWALMESKRMLAQIRGKYLNLPGPNGSTSLNAQDLNSQADSERERLMEELLDPAMGNLEDQGLAPHFVIG